MNSVWGIKPAIICSIAFTIAEYVWLRLQNQKINSFFYLSSGVIIIFGTLDLFIKTPVFLKWEAAVINILFAGFFAFSIFKEKSIVQEFAETQGRVATESNADTKFFFNCFTLFWTIYFLAKAILYLWLNFNYQFEDALIFRVFTGKISLFIMIGISILLPRKIWALMERARMFPSQRV